MKTIIVLIAGFISLFIIRCFKKTLYNVAGIFTIMWTICLGLSTLGLYGMNSPSYTVVLLFCISVFVLSFTSVIKISPKTIRLGSVSVVTRTNSVEYKPLTDNMLLYLCNCVAYIFSIPYLIKAISLIQSSGWYTLREFAFKGSDYASTAVLLIFQTFIAPLFVVTMLLCAIDIGRGYIIKKAIILSVSNALLYTFLFGGRYMFFQLLVFYVFSIYDGYGKSIIKLLSKNKKSIFFIIFIIFVILVITERRTSIGLFKSMYIYFCGSFSYLSYLLDNEIGTNLFLLGKTQFGFIYNFIYLGISFVTNIDYKGSNHLITQLTQYTVRIGEGISYNSLGTMLHDFIADYGVWGCPIGIFIFGIGSRYVEELKNRTHSSFYYALYIYLLYSAVNSVFGYTFRNPGSLLILIYLYIFCKKK